MKKILFSLSSLLLLILSLNTGKVVNADVVVGTVPVGTLPAYVVVNPVTNKIYVSNFTGASVSVIDGTDNSTITIPTGERPREMAVNTVTNKIYVSNLDGSSVTVIDGTNNSTATVAVGSQPSGIAVNSVTNKVYVANSAFNTPADVTVIDGATNSTTTIPIGLTINLMAVNETTNKIYVGARANNSVVVIDGATGSKTPVPVGSRPASIVVNSVTNKVFVGNTDSADVTVIEGADNTTKTIATRANPTATALNQETNKVYIANYNNSNITVIDGLDLSVSQISTWTNPSGVAVNSTTNKIYVTNRGSNNVTVIDGTNNSTTTVLADRLPGCVAVNPVTNKIYVCNAGGNNVSVIDGTSAPTPTPGPSPAGLVSHWTGDGNAHDTIGGNNGSLMNGATYTTGVLGQAFSFDGMDDYMQAPTVGLPTESKDRTLTMWVKIDAPVSNESFFGGYGTFGGLTNAYFLGGSGQNSSLFFSQWGAGVSGPQLKNGRWYHLAVTNIGNQTTLFVDGHAGAGVPTIATSPDSQFYLGTFPGTHGSTRRLQGAIDDVRMYNRALSDTEIQTIFLEGSKTTAEVSGRVLTTTGRGLGNASVSITGNDLSRTVLTNALGFYSFSEVPTGHTYTVNVRSKRYRFLQRSVEVNAELSDVDFSGIE